VVDDLVPLRVNEHQCTADAWCPSGPARATDSAREARSASVISLDLRRRGRTRIVARVPGLADTLVVTVVDSSAAAPSR
jgi:hypothetical protein